MQTLIAESVNPWGHMPPKVQGFLLASFAALLVAAGVAFLGRRSPRAVVRLIRIVLLVVASIGVIMFAGTYATYAKSNVLSDHVEAWDICLAWSWGQGQPLYHQIGETPCYSSVYGPAMYLLYQAVLRLIHPSPVACKLAIGMLLAAGFFLVWRARRPAVGWAATLLGGGYYALALAGMTPYAAASFWLRAEPLLIFCTCLSVFGCNLQRRWFAVATIAVAFGTAGAIKPHGILYTLPAIGILFQRFGARTALLAGLASGAMTAVYFVGLPGVDVSNYLRMLQMALHHGFSPRLMAGILFRLCSVTLPVVVFGLWYLRTRQCQPWTVVRRHLPFIAIIAFSIALALIPASKPGAGPHHLLPFLPWGLWIVWGTLPMLPFLVDRPEARVSRGFALASLVAAAWIFIPAASECLTFVRELRMAKRTDDGAEDEVAQIAEMYKGHKVCMGIAGNENHRLTFCKWILVFSGGPYLYEPSVLMDYAYAGIALSDRTAAAMTDGTIYAWVLPSGNRPFTMANLYDFSQDIFSDDMRRRFAANYEKGFSTRHFDVWTYRRLAR